MNFTEVKKPNKNQDEAFIDELAKMLDDPHKDLAWNEKFKELVRKHFDL
tara:strand:+ start:215 stop:361 length:147 start_codon:yes stop_codon:yes gene_type:complete